jgi:hypothetical protein
MQRFNMAIKQVTANMNKYNFVVGYKYLEDFI